jgi:hypothetical protein
MLSAYTVQYSKKCELPVFKNTHKGHPKEYIPCFRTFEEYPAQLPGIY